MRYKDISDVDLVDEGWADNIKKTAIAGATALGIGTAGADLAYNFSHDASASVGRQHYMGGPTNDLLNRMDKERQIQAPDDDNENYPKQLLGKEGAELKKAFIDHITPMVKANNAAIIKERNKILELSKKHHLSPKEEKWLESRFEKYRVGDNDIQELISKVDVVPLALAVSQAALESGWGTSRLARQGNALFGQKTTADDSIDSETDKYAKFTDFSDSIESYMRNLNSHPAYKAFREERAYQRKKGQKFNSKALASTLLKYSTRGKEYVKHVKQIMAANDLDQIS